jgi:hypothetical protein
MPSVRGCAGWCASQRFDALANVVQFGIGHARTGLDVIHPAGELVCITVYKRDAEKVVRRLAA